MKRSLAGKEVFTFEDLKEIVRILRAPDGCPWDKEQSHESLRNNLIEEAFEVCEGIDEKNSSLICEELGDVLLQVVFHCSIAEDEKEFTTEDAISGVCRKMIRRHPHIFASETVEPEKLQDLWDRIKKEEKGDRSLFDTLSRISKALPNLKRAEKFIEKGAPEIALTSEDSKLFRFGERFYDLCRECVAAEVDPEEALEKYLTKVLKKAEEIR